AVRRTARAGGPGGLRQERRQLPGGSRGTARPPLVRRLPVPPGVHLHAPRWPSAVHRLRQRGAGAQGGAHPRPVLSPGVKRMSMPERTIEIAGLKAGNSLPLMLFGGMNVLESRELALEVAEAYVEVTGRL